MGLRVLPKAGRWKKQRRRADAGSLGGGGEGEDRAMRNS